MLEHLETAQWRSMLYVPANRERYVASAVGAGADAIILDLEDAVPAERKTEARHGLGEAVATLRAGSASVLVRVNRPWTLMIRDLEASVEAGVDAVVVPKSDDAGVIRAVDETLTELETGSPRPPLRLVALIESARGLRRVDSIVAASDRVVAAWPGMGDLCIDLQASPDSPAVAQAFNDVVQATRGAGRTALGLAGTMVSFKDLDAFRALATRSRAAGSRGASCIHPSQVAVLNEVFSPSADELSDARRLVAAYEESAREGHGTVMMGDTFIDKANYTYAHRLLVRHGDR